MSQFQLSPDRVEVKRGAEGRTRRRGAAIWIFASRSYELRASKAKIMDSGSSPQTNSALDAGVTERIAAFQEWFAQSGGWIHPSLSFAKGLCTHVAVGFCARSVVELT